MKRGGRVIYGGKLGERSQTMIDYFQVRLKYIINYLTFAYISYVPMCLWHIMSMAIN